MTKTKRSTRPATAEVVEKNIALATKEARVHLRRLLVVSWASGTPDPKQEHRAVVATVKEVAADLLGEGVDHKGNRTPPAPTECGLILRAILPSIERLQPAKRLFPHNERKRNRKIAQVRNDICKKYKLTREAGNPIITGLLAELGITLAEDSLRRFK